jgi:tetratricopeptide (TPR) repeat protein
MESIDVDGTPFSVHMDRAVKLRSVQSKHERLKYDAYPTFYAKTIFPDDDVSNARRYGPFNERLAAANRLKEEGNSAYRDGRPSDALKKYEMAASVFRFLENTNPEWKSEGIKDRFITEVEYECKSEEERRELDRFLVVCYNNIALASCRMNNFPLAIQACDCAIAIDGRNEKAYYLRSRARTGPKSSGASEETMARDDLLMALNINSDNRDARILLQRLSSDMKEQRANEKTAFGGLFGRGAIRETQVLHEQNEADRKRAEKDTLDSRERDIILGKELARFCDERGMTEEKGKIKQSLNYGAKTADETPLFRDIDFRGPTARMDLLEELKAGGQQEWLRNAERSDRPLKPCQLSKNRSSRPVGTLQIQLKILLSIVVIWYSFAYLELFRATNECSFVTPSIIKNHRPR